MKTAAAITLTSTLVNDLFVCLSHLSYDGRAEMLAVLVAKHSMENTDPEVTSFEEAEAISSSACELIETAMDGGDHAALS